MYTVTLGTLLKAFCLFRRLPLVVRGLGLKLHENDIEVGGKEMLPHRGVHMNGKKINKTSENRLTLVLPNFKYEKKRVKI